MKAITVRPVWAWAIIYAGKNIENRSWRTHLRGPIAIHASKNITRSEYEVAGAALSRRARRHRTQCRKAGCQSVADLQRAGVRSVC